jgi:hypothetical protein
LPQTKINKKTRKSTVILKAGWEAGTNTERICQHSISDSSFSKQKTPVKTPLENRRGHFVPAARPEG